MNQDINIPSTEGLTFEKVWLMFQESEKRSQKIDERIDKLSKLYGNVSENSKDVAKEFFFRGLENRSDLFGISYEHIDRMERHTKKMHGEFDIVLYNGDFIIVIEVKYKLHPNDVIDFHNRKLPNFIKLYPEYKDKKILGAVAGLSVSNDSYEEAVKLGFLVLTQSGENMVVLNDPDFKPIEFSY